MTTLRYHRKDDADAYPWRKGWHISDGLGQEGDHDLVRRAQQGDATAYDELMLRHQEAIAVQMRRFSPSLDVVEDLTQTVFVRAYQGLATYEPRAPFVNWLRTIANRVGYEHWRREARQIKFVPMHGKEEMVAAPEQGDTVEERFAQLTGVMNQLKPAERQALYLLYVDGLSVAETAHCMGWNQAMTKMRAYRARMKLRKILGSEVAKGLIIREE